MKNENDQVLSHESSKPRRPRSREVSSRFLSPSSTTSRETGMSTSPNNQSLSPIRHKPRTATSASTRKQRSIEETGLIRLWPSSAISSSPKSNKNLDTLAHHLGNERLKDRKNDKKQTNADRVFPSGRRSSNESSGLQNGKEIGPKEKHRASLGGSARCTGKLTSPGKSSSSVLLNTSSKSSGFLPGRLSIDENEMNRRKYENSDSFTSTLDLDSECSDGGSSTEFGSTGIGLQKSDVEVSSKYTRDISHAMRVSDSNITNMVSSDSFQSSKKFTIKNAIRRVNSLTVAKSQWALSPGRSRSPPLSVESKGKPMSFSSLKPPNAPARATGMEKLLNMGLDLLKGKKSSSGCSSPMLLGINAENVHQLRLLHNRLLQWRYANARAEAVNGSIADQAERNLMYAWDGLKKLRLSVAYKKLHLEKEKLRMKLNYILYSQIRLLPSWGDMERQHLLAVSKIKESLHAVVCRVPLTDGAKAHMQLAAITLGDALDLTTSMRSIFTGLAPSAGNTATVVSELAQVVAQEKLLLEECLELFRTISTLELHERSLRCSIIQLSLQLQLQQQQQQRKQLERPSYMVGV